MPSPSNSSKRKAVTEVSFRPVKLHKASDVDIKAVKQPLGRELFNTLRRSLYESLVIGDELNVPQKYSDPSDVRAANWILKYSLPFLSFEVQKDSLVKEFINSFPNPSQSNFTNQSAFDIHYKLKKSPFQTSCAKIIQMMQVPMDTLFSNLQKLFVKLWNHDDSSKPLSDANVESLTDEFIRFRRQSYRTNSIRQGNLVPVSPSESCKSTDKVQVYLTLEKPFDFLMNQLLTFMNVPELVHRLTVCGKVVEHWKPRLPERFIPKNHVVHTSSYT